MGRDFFLADDNKRGIACVIKPLQGGRAVVVWQLPVLSSFIGYEWLRDFLVRHLQPFNVKRFVAEQKRIWKERITAPPSEDLTGMAVDYIKTKDRRSVLWS